MLNYQNSEDEPIKFNQVFDKELDKWNVGSVYVKNKGFFINPYK